MSTAVDLMRPCRERGHDGPRWLPATLEFFDRQGTLADGSVKLASYCKPCCRRLTRERQRGVKRVRPEGYYRGYLKRAIQDVPEKRAAKNAYQREYKRARSTNPRPHLWIDRPGTESGYVDSAPVRAAIEASGLTVAEAGRRAGYTSNAGRHFLSRGQIQARTAARLLRAIGADPVEVGL